jgi:glycosyltransferase involved in cell wall biosynthesis
MNDNPLVSVLIPTFNYGRFLDEAIQSVLAQSYQNFELIIVDNHSRDNTREVVSAYLADKRISFYQNESNIGLVANWNKCLGYAKGEFIKFLMADDLFQPELLSEMVGVMLKYPNVTLVTSNSDVFGSKNKPRISKFIGLQQGRELIFKCLKHGAGNLIGEPTTVMFRRRDLRKVGNFNPNFTCLVDFNMWLRLLNIGDAYFIAKSLSGFRAHNDQFSAKTRVSNWIDEYQFYKYIRDRNPYQIDKAGILEMGLDDVLHDRAIHCAKGMYRMLPKLLTGSDEYHTFAKALNITTREGVISQSFYSMLKKYI